MNWLLRVVLVGTTGITERIIEFRSKQSCDIVEAFYRVEVQTKVNVIAVVSNCFQGE